MTAATTTAEGERLRRVSPLRLFFSRPESGAIAGAVIVFLIFGVLSALRGDIGKACAAHFGGEAGTQRY